MRVWVLSVESQANKWEDSLGTGRTFRSMGYSHRSESVLQPSRVMICRVMRRRHVALGG